MYSQRLIEFLVGLFIVAAFMAFAVLAFRVSGLTSYTDSNTFTVTAEFTNIGDLKVRAPVTVAGVVVGRVTQVTLDENNYKALVTIQLDKNSRLPDDSSASILTAGLIGANYIEITPGFNNTYFKNGSRIARTSQALILQHLVGQLMFSLKNGNSKDEKKS